MALKLLTLQAAAASRDHRQPECTVAENTGLTSVTEFNTINPPARRNSMATKYNNDNDISPLHFAVLNNEPQLIDDLLKSGGEVNCRTRRSQLTPIHWAAAMGRLECLKLLHKNGGSLISQDGTQQGNEPIHLSVLYGREETTRWLLDTQVSPNRVNKKGITPLFYAVAREHIYVLLLLLKAGANVNAAVRDLGNITPLHVAVKQRHRYIIMTLLTNGANPAYFCTANYQTPYHWAAVIGDLKCLMLMDTLEIDLSLPTTDRDGHHCIHLASSNGHTPVVQWFIGKGVSVNIMNNYGFTPLHIAANCGHCDLVEFLLKNNAEVNIRANNNKRNTPLDLAAYQGNKDVLRLLLKAGADANAEDRLYKYTPMHFAAMNNSLDCLIILAAYGGNLRVHMGSESGEELLVTAAKHDSVDIAKWLINYANTPCDMSDKDGLTPLHHASMCGSQKVAFRLLFERADVNIASRNVYQMTPLHYAVLRRHVNITILLSLFGADFHAQSSDKLNPLHYAAMTGDINCMMVLINNGGNIRVSTGNRQGDFPIHIATSFGHDNMVHLLLDEGLSVNIPNRLGATPLIIAAREGFCSLVQLLLNKGANVNAVVSEVDCITALHSASTFGHVGVVKLLLQRGADVGAVTSYEHRTALHLAAESGHLDITKLLVTYFSNKLARDRQGFTAWDLAACKGHKDICKLLKPFRLKNLLKWPQNKIT
jgi:ankyrin repeat protein